LDTKDIAIAAAAITPNAAINESMLCRPTANNE
jgi:hypothetical protein